MEIPLRLGYTATQQLGAAMPRIEGDENDNLLEGGLKSDQIFGFGGDDTLDGGLDGDDRLDGGAGDDTIQSAGRGETLALGGDGDDLIFGGPDGGDVLDGGAGNDIVALEYSGDPDIDRGRSTVIGGDGFDELAIRIYGGSSETVLSLSGELIVNGVVRATTSGFESASFYADAGAHKVTGTDGADSLWTAGGLDDTLFGGDGDDTIRGEEGRDRIDAGGGRDAVILDDARGDRVDLGAGDDRLEVLHELDEGGAVGRYEGRDGYDAIDFTLFGDKQLVEFDGRTLTVAGAALAELTGFESISIEGSRLTGLSGNDSLYGAQTIEDAHTNRLVGRGGDDLLQGYGGRNVLIGGVGDDTLETVVYGSRDTLDGGEGEDRLELDYGYEAIVMTGDLQSGVTVTHGGATTVLAKGFESVFVTDSDDDDVLIGGVGDDSIRVGSGSDVLSTFGGDDYVFVLLDEFADQIDLGEGTDRASLNLVGDERVVMRDDAGIVSVTVGRATAATIAGAESFNLWTGGGDDRLIGGDLSDAFWGGGGRNILLGRGGDDIFRAEVGDNNTINGGAGEDRLVLESWNGSGGPIVTTIGADGDITITVDGRITLEARSVEVVELHGDEGDDLLIGLSLDDVLLGFEGTDTLVGGAGDDLLGAAGAGSYRGGAGTDTISFQDWYEEGVDLTLASRAAIIEGQAGLLKLSGIENVVGSRLSDAITGDAGDNVIEGGEGADVLEGGAGIDTLSYSSEDDGVVINLEDGTAATELVAGAYIWTDRIGGFENVVGSSGDDRITGDDGANHIEGGRASDFLTGGGGADTFVFAAGDTGSRFAPFDLVTDFSGAEGDRIDLSAMTEAAGGALAFVGGAAFSGAAGEVRFSGYGNGIELLIDLDGDARADDAIRLNGVTDIAKDDLILS